jgi:hypothetical protein
MNRDNHLMLEALQSKFTGRGPVNDIVVSELHKMHTALNQMATMIDLNPSDEVDQLLSRIRDTADMLISERPAAEDDAEPALKNTGAGAIEASAEDAEETAEQRIAAVKQAVARAKVQIAQAKIQGQMKHYGDGLAKALGKSENAEHEPHGYPQGITAIQNLLINQLKKHGFTLTKILHADKERDKYPTVFMKKSQGAMHIGAEIDGMGYINGEPFKEYMMVRGYDAKNAGNKPYTPSGARPDPEDPAYDTWQSIAQDHAGEDAEGRSNAQHAAIAIALQKAGKKK